jgi:choline kinase
VVGSRAYEEALVLAGGVGSRLSSVTGGKPKYVFNIRGLPLTLYPILTLSLIGVSRFVIVVAEKFVDMVEDEFSRLLSRIGIEVVYVSNPHPELENGYSLLLGVKEIKSSEFIVTVGDHLYSTGLARTITSYGLEDADVKVGGDSAPKYVDVNEATRILADKNRRLISIGKNLDKFTHIDVGLFLFKKKVFREVERLEREAKVKLSLSNLILTMQRRGVDVKVAELENALWCDVDTPRDLAELLGGERTIVLETVRSEVSRKLEL